MLAKRIAQRIQRMVRPQPEAMAGSRSDSELAYESRVLAEQSHFSGSQTHNELPGIYSYWSNKYLRPKLESLGYITPENMFSQHFVRAYKSREEGPRSFVSLGSGSCDTEIRIAQFMQQQGCDDFVIECFELNPALVSQGAAAAAKAGLSGKVLPVVGDFNVWRPTKFCDGVLANNSLHHVVNLEGLFSGIQQSLLSTGTFVTSDMIGCNGHMRWPEALEIVNEFWRELPAEKTYNHLLSRREALYENWDCSSEGFEGVRAQDILPLLIAHFEFDVFVPFANVIDPFIDRPFGPNFDQTNPEDRAFIDRVHARDAAEIARGAIKPTHIVAAMCTGRAGTQQYVDGLTPSFSVRYPVRAPIATYVPPPPEPEVPDEPMVPKEPPKPTPRFNYSDLWWNPLQPGWGLAINQHGTGRLVGTWLTYTMEREPVWYSIQPGQWIDDQTYEGVLYIAYGPYYGTHDANSKPAQLLKVGSFRIVFTDELNGTATCVMGKVVWSSAISRMEF